MALNEPIAITEPGDVLREELESRAMTQEDLSEIMGRPLKAINALIRGTKRVTAETAIQLEEALDIDAEFWLRMEEQRQLFKARQASVETGVARKRRLYEFAPVREMVKRGWIKGNSDVEQLEQDVLAFFGVQSMDQPLPHAAAYRATNAATTDRHSRIAWICEAKHMADAQTNIAEFNATANLDDLVAEQLKPLFRRAEDTARVPEVLARVGIHFVVLPTLPKTRIDGAMVHSDNKRPIIAMSLRYGTLDGFWFTLLHELAHIHLGHHESFDDFASKEDMEQAAEQDANRVAADWLLPQDDYAEFVSSHTGFFPKAAVERFADKHEVHPAIVVGRLKHEQRIPWSVHRPLQVSVKSFIA